jgi:hypothetical protein
MRTDLVELNTKFHKKIHSVHLELFFGQVNSLMELLGLHAVAFESIRCNRNFKWLDNFNFENVIIRRCKWNEVASSRKLNNLSVSNAKCSNL